MDYKNRIPGYRPPRPPRKKSRTGLWAGLAVAGGLVAVALAWTLTRPKDAPQPSPEQTGSNTTTAVPLPPPAPPVETSKPGDKKPIKPVVKDATKPGTAKPTVEPAVKPPEPRFTFYKILPELEAIVPESEIKDLKREESLGKKPPEVKQYLLQAGSFTNLQDAEKLKARLSALKIKSRIENVKIENTAWNRVKIGPFTSLAAADKVRTYLKGCQIDSVVQKSVTKPAQTPTGR